MSWIEFTCGECGNKYTEQTGDVDERVCDECLNHEDEFGCDDEYSYKDHTDSVVKEKIAQYGSLEKAVFEMEGRIIDLTATIEGMREYDRLLKEEETDGCPGYDIDADEDGLHWIKCDHKECDKTHKNLEIVSCIGYREEE